MTRFGCFILGLLAASTSFVEPATGAVRFAVIGDYGVDNANEKAVADLVRTNLQPDFIVTVGDNQYGGAADIDRNIGKYYHSYIANYRGSYGAGASSNRFFPALGNHDYLAGSGYSVHLNYFTLPGNERYYDVALGPVHLFVINSEVNEPHGTTSTSTQARWLSNRLAVSTAPWKLVFCHDPPYSSSSLVTPRMRWPFEQWGASAVFSGSAHHYERISRNGFPYVVNGAGGAALVGFGTAIAGSMIRYSQNHGAMLVEADATQITFEFHSVARGGTRVDQVKWTANPTLGIHPATNRAITVTWDTNAAWGFQLESLRWLGLSSSWSMVNTAPVTVRDRRAVTLPLSTSNQFFRLRRP